LLLQTADGALILLSYRGRWYADSGHLERLMKREGDLDDGNSYLRVCATFETAAPEYHWLTKLISVGVGRLKVGGIDYEFHEVL